MGLRRYELRSRAWPNFSWIPCEEGGREGGREEGERKRGREKAVCPCDTVMDVSSPLYLAEGLALSGLIDEHLRVGSVLTVQRIHLELHRLSKGKMSHQGHVTTHECHVTHVLSETLPNPLRILSILLQCFTECPDDIITTINDIT